MISKRDGAALYLKARRVRPPRIRLGLGCAMRRSSLSLYSKVYGAVAPRGSRDVRVATPSLTSWRER
jgi:hypothetical protein